MIFARSTGRGATGRVAAILRQVLVQPGALKPTPSGEHGEIPVNKAALLIAAGSEVAEIVIAQGWNVGSHRPAGRG